MLGQVREFLRGLHGVVAEDKAQRGNANLPSGDPLWTPTFLHEKEHYGSMAARGTTGCCFASCGRGTSDDIKISDSREAY